MENKLVSAMNSFISHLRLETLLDRVVPNLVANALGGDDVVARCCVMCGKTEDEGCSTCSIGGLHTGKKRHHYSADSSECSVGWPSCQGCSWGAEDSWECLYC